MKNLETIKSYKISEDYVFLFLDEKGLDENLSVAISRDVIIQIFKTMLNNGFLRINQTVGENDL